MSTDLVQIYRQLAIAKAKQCSCRKFHLFRYLPLEIRVQIWIDALPLRPGTIYLGTCDILCRSTYGLLGACRESNQVVLRTLPGWVHTFDKITFSWRLPRLSFNPDLDIFFLPWTQIQRQIVPTTDPLMYLRHITMCAPEFNYLSSRLVLRRCVNLQTIVLIVQLAACGGHRQLYDLVGGADPLRPTSTPASIRLPREQETYTNFLEPSRASDVLRIYDLLSFILNDLQQDFNQGLLAQVPSIKLKGMKYMQREIFDWITIRNWMRGLLELNNFTRGRRYRICPKRPCSACVADGARLNYKLYPVIQQPPKLLKLPIYLWAKIWKMAAPTRELEHLESFFSHAGQGIKSLGAAESLQLRTHNFHIPSRLVTIGLYEADVKFTSLINIQFHAEGIFNFWDMSKWRTLGWGQTQIATSWGTHGSFARSIKKVEMKSGDTTNATGFAFSEIAHNMSALEEVIVLRKVSGSNLTLRYITQI